MLDVMMTKQKELQSRLGTNFADLSDEERAQFMRNHRGYLEDELAEALYEMPNYKLWKSYDSMSPEAREVAWQKVRMELIDAFHFFMNMLLCAGMDAKEVFQMYLAKNQENHARQDRGYTSEVSYRDQPVEDVMTPEDTCTVISKGEVCGSSNFVTFLNTLDGNTHMFYNTDALSMGVAAGMARLEFESILDTLSNEDREDVLEALARGGLYE